MTDTSIYPLSLALILIIALIALSSVILGVRHIRRHRQELAAIECNPTLVMFQATLPYNVKWLNRHLLHPFYVNQDNGDVLCKFDHETVTLSVGDLTNPIDGTTVHADCPEAVIRQFLLYIEQTLKKCHDGKVSNVFVSPHSTLTSILVSVSRHEISSMKEPRDPDGQLDWIGRDKYTQTDILYGSGSRTISVYYDNVPYRIAPDQIHANVFNAGGWLIPTPNLTLDGVIHWTISRVINDKVLTLHGDSDLVHLLSAIYDDERRTIKEIARRAAGIAASNLTLDEDISGWDVGNVISMDSMLTDCSNFNSECTDTTQAVIATMDTDDVSDDTTRRSKKDRVITVSGDAFEHSPALRHTPSSSSSTSDSSSDSSGSSSSSSSD